jgi:exopolysaccharide production protein ExoQ
MIQRVRRPARRPRGPPAPAIPVGRRRDRKWPALIAGVLFWLLVARVTVPDSFSAGPDIESLEAAAQGAFLSKITWSIFLGCGFALVISRMNEATRLLRTTNVFFLALLIYAIASLAWSIDYVASSARLFRVITIVLACVAVALTGWQSRRFQEVARPVVTLLLLGSLIFGLIAPDLAIEMPVPPDTRYYWHGLATKKNELGALASMGVIFWFHGWAAREVKLWIAAPWACVCGACLLLSHSSTSILATTLVCGLLLLMLRSYRGMRRYLPYVVGLLVVLTLTYGLAVLDVVPGLDVVLTPITALTGKDRTFTNRTQIWEIIRAHISLSPVLGSGYGGYWAGPKPDSPSYVFMYRMFFYPSECHNGYLDIINDLGYAGLLILFGYLGTFLRQSLNLLKTNHQQASLYLAILFQQLLTNLSESHWFFIQADFVIFTLATLCLARHGMDRKPVASVSRNRAPVPIVRART